MQSMLVIPDITEIAIFRSKYADISRTQGVCHMIYVLFGCLLDKVCQISSM